MTAKIYIENKLVKTKYYQTNRQSKASISNGITQLINNVSLIGLQSYIVLTSKLNAHEIKHSTSDQQAKTSKGTI